MSGHGARETRVREKGRERECEVASGNGRQRAATGRRRQWQEMSVGAH